MVSIILIIGICLTVFHLTGCDENSTTNDTADSSEDSTTTETEPVSLGNNYVVVDTGQNIFLVIQTKFLHHQQVIHFTDRMAVIVVPSLHTLITVTVLLQIIIPV